MAAVFAEFTKEENELVERIVVRADTMFRKFGMKLDRLSLRMDLSATHARVPLDFARLLEFPDFDFSHDIGGIAKHMNRETGRLKSFFLPRCSLPDGKKAT